MTGEFLEGFPDQYFILIQDSCRSWPLQTGHDNDRAQQFSVSSSEPGNETDTARDNRKLAALLEENGYNITWKEVASGPGWGTWRSRTDAVLETLLPLK